jgi:hypothetical protein
MRVRAMRYLTVQSGFAGHFGTLLTPAGATQSLHFVYQACPSRRPHRTCVPPSRRKTPHPLGYPALRVDQGKSLGGIGALETEASEGITPRVSLPPSRRKG